MKALVIYGSTLGNTRRVVSRVPEMLDFLVDVVDVKTLDDAASLSAYDLLIFFSSTWGDGELQVDMEAFLVRASLQLDGKLYAICELGNYYGYDDFNFGAERILHYFLHDAGGVELAEPFSMDSLPHKDWIGLERWCQLINQKIRNHYA
jgi:flavodoxin